MGVTADIGKTFSFRHGVHPEEYKYLSENRVIERMPFVEEYTLPLGQHIGGPGNLIVSKGDRVQRGQKLTEPGGFVSVSLHAPVDGVVSEVGLVMHPSGQLQHGLKIKTDPYSSQQFGEDPIDYQSMDVKEFINTVQQYGLVGLGGAAFPAHVKFSIPEGKTCRYIMVNGCECEPFLTADHRVMKEHAQEVIDGISILNHFIKAEKVFIGVEVNKPDAILALRKACTDVADNIEVAPLKVKYPQGAEKMMITAIMGQEVPSGKLPLDVEVLVSNVGSVAALSDIFRKGKPLIERVVTITGPAVNRPSNLMIPIGTRMKDVVDYCGGLKDNLCRILLGGPMMGAVQKSLDVPVVKGTSGILAVTEKEVGQLDQYNCVRCSRCLDACPMFLNPSLLGLLAKKGLWEEMMEHNLMDCFECASCSFVCPSGIPLVQSFRVAKGFLREAMAREKAKIKE